jgi:hypothetical protein
MWRVKNTERWLASLYVLYKFYIRTKRFRRWLRTPAHNIYL